MFRSAGEFADKAAISQDEMHIATHILGGKLIQIERHKATKMVGRSLWNHMDGYKIGILLLLMSLNGEST